MKFFGLFAVVLAVLAMLMSSSQASPAPAPAPGVKGVIKGAKTVFGVVSTVGTAKEIYDRVRNRG